MKIRLISVGSKMSAWVQQGFDEYEKRIRTELGFSITEIALAKRSKSRSIEQCIEKEGELILAQIQKDEHVIALEVTGKQLDTPSLAGRLDALKMQGRNLCLLIGGPDGLSEICRQRANEQWSMSALTLPHPLVRILLAEQLYRASCILKGHPYHRQ